MEIPEDIIATAAGQYAVFAFDEGTLGEIRAAKIRFNDMVNESYVTLTRSALMAGFHRPNASEFRAEFITQCRKLLKRKGTG